VSRFILWLNSTGQNQRWPLLLWRDILRLNVFCAVGCSDFVLFWENREYWDGNECYIYYEMHLENNLYIYNLVPLRWDLNFLLKKINKPKTSLTGIKVGKFHICFTFSLVTFSFTFSDFFYGLQINFRQYFCRNCKKRIKPFVTVSPGIEPGYIVFPSHKNSV
jgi:hypothetical protein